MTLIAQPFAETGAASKDGLNPKQRAFLAAYSELGNLSAAASAARVHRRSHYYWLKQPGYAAAFNEAQEDAHDNLFEEARRRAVDGVEEPILYRGKPVYEQERDSKTGQLRATNKVVVRRRYSDELLMFLLKAQRPDKYRDNWTGELPRPAMAPVSVRIDLNRLDDSERKQLKSIARKVEIGSDRNGFNAQLVVNPRLNSPLAMRAGRLRPSRPVASDN